MSQAPLLPTCSQGQGQGQGAGDSTPNSGTATPSVVHPPHSPPPLAPSQAVPASSSHPLHSPRWAKLSLTGRPNLWARFRHAYKEQLAEVVGTSMILIFGLGVECQVNLHFTLAGHDFSAGDFNSQRFGWATGVAVGIWVAAGSSGAHLNPTVTLALWLFRGFPGRKVLGFIVSQIIGAFLGAVIIYSNYSSSIDIYEGAPGRRTVFDAPRDWPGENKGHSSSGLFVTKPQEWLSWRQAAWSEALASAVLVMTVFALSDNGNLAVPKGVMPIAMFLLLLGIGFSLGVDTGYAINLARDLGPRLFCYLLGGYPFEIISNHSYWTFWGPGLASMLGGIAGGFVYDLAIYTGRDSPVNRLQGGGRLRSDAVGMRGQGGRDGGEEEEEEDHQVQTAAREV